MPQKDDLPELEEMLKHSSIEYDFETVYTSEEIDALRPFFAAYNVKRAVLFGSYAKGTQHAVSDIDILVSGQFKGWDFYGLMEEIYQALRKEIELIECGQLTPGSRIEREIEARGIVLYESVID